VKKTYAEKKAAKAARDRAERDAEIAAYVEFASESEALGPLFSKTQKMVEQLQRVMERPQFAGLSDMDQLLVCRLHSSIGHFRDMVAMQYRRLAEDFERVVDASDVLRELLASEIPSPMVKPAIQNKPKEA
jgi:hypothetical protein